MTIAIVGKYVNLRDAYLSVMEALKHGGFAHGADVQIEWVASDDLGRLGDRRGARETWTAS